MRGLSVRCDSERFHPVLVGFDGVGSAEFFLRRAGADDVDPVQFRLRGDFLLISPPGKAPVCDIGDEVLADLALVDDLETPRSDLGNLERGFWSMKAEDIDLRPI